MRMIAAGALMSALLIPSAYSQNFNNKKSRHVLLVSIDGMHAVDYGYCVAHGTCPNLAALGRTGVNYTRTSTSQPSDSFPGLMAIVTGGTPKLVGAYYDVAYDRVLAPPAKDTGNGNFAGTCKTNTPNGTTTEYEEGDDIDQTQLTGGGPYTGFDGGVLSLDPQKLVRDPYNNCLPVYPWNFIRANTIFGVAHAAGLYTAWSDKHAAYAAVSGPTGTPNPSNVDDYYSPEINSNIEALPGIVTPPTPAHPSGINCDVPGSPMDTPPDNNGGAWTDSFINIQCYDTLKVRAVLNWIDGKTHLGASKAPVPAIFGMNFQTVSVNQKLIESGVKGGYTDAQGTPSAHLEDAIEFVDASIGEWVQELKKHNLFDDTVIIVTAKHGQSPIDPNRFTEIGTAADTIANDPATVVENYLPAVPSPENPLTTAAPDNPMLGPIGPTEDDISLLWLAPGADVSAAVSALETAQLTATNGAATGIGLGQIFWGDTLKTIYGNPGLPPYGDPRTPDIIVQPNPGVVYTGSHKKQEEHGGFDHDDTNVMMLVSNPHFQPQTWDAFVETVQVAPTILDILGLDPAQLKAVQVEGTPALPGLNLD